MSKHHTGEDRPKRINRIARRYAARSERQRHVDPKRFGTKKPMLRLERKSQVKLMIAYDLETTRFIFVK